MSAATEEFWAKRKARDELGAQIEKQIEAVQWISDVLSGSGTRYYSGRAWQWVQIISGGNIPSHLAESPLEFNLKDWPDIRNLSNLISQWHALDWEYRQAWVRMSTEEKEQFAAHAPEEHRPPNRY
jgi:hypothetical protein